MNLDLLTKLVRLANNNPNDNEANLAARRACKLIEEGKFQFGVNTSKVVNKPQVNSQPQWYPNPFDAFNNYYQQQKQRTASEAQQQARAQQSQQNTGQHRCKNCGAHLEYISIVMGNKLCSNCDPRTKEKWENYKYGSWDTETKSKPPTQENVTVNCLFCKQDFKRKTYDVNFICHQCHVKKNKADKPSIIFNERDKTYYKSIFCYNCGHGFTHSYSEAVHQMLNSITGQCEKCNTTWVRDIK